MQALHRTDFLGPVLHSFALIDRPRLPQPRTILQGAGLNALEPLDWLTYAGTALIVGNILALCFY